MFRAVFPSIIRSSKLRIQQQVYVKQLQQQQQQLFDIYRCCIRSFELLMMDKKPPETCRAFYKNK
jgi:ABC-type uncharacterized transport system ATPase subunit